MIVSPFHSHRSNLFRICKNKLKYSSGLSDCGGYEIGKGCVLSVKKIYLDSMLFVLTIALRSKRKRLRKSRVRTAVPRLVKLSDLIFD
jgi:hypothetical protein